MMRFVVSLLFVLLVAFQASAQLKEILPPQEDVRVTDRLIFIFDCSTSMGDQDRFAKALEGLKFILQAPIDDGMFSILTFKTSGFDNVHIIYEWEGVDDGKTPKNWAKLPSQESVEKAEKWLSTIKCDMWTDI